MVDGNSMDSMSLPDCLLCKRNRWKSLDQFTANARLVFPGRIIQCRYCGLARLSKFPTTAALSDYYAGQAYLSEYAAAGISMVTEDKEVQEALHQRLAYLQSLRSAHGRLLDIGASTGTFLSMARQSGWEVSGVELGDDGVRVARERHGIDLHHGAIETAPFAADSFDVIHASHVLEHLSEPQIFLGHVHRLLKPGGVIAIEVPSELGDMFSWIQQSILRRPPVTAPVPSPHLFFYTPRSLELLLRQSGFRILLTTTPRRNRSMTSRLPLGTVMKPLVYRLEETMQWGPLIEIYAARLS